jgi:flavin reductase (DIM6/NTAB) family NADH-FMN oxidoreductase RutF
MWCYPLEATDVAFGRCLNKEVPVSVLNSASLAPSQELTVDTDRFKGAMRHLAGAVSVITVGQGADRTGFTATSVTSLAIDPPSVLVSLNRNSSSWPALQRHGAFVVNVLAHDQQHIADRFTGRDGIRGSARYDGAIWQDLVTGTPALTDALTVLDCELEEAIDRHSHAILIGRVRAITIRHDADPLLYWHGSYRQLQADR